MITFVKSFYGIEEDKIFIIEILQVGQWFAGPRHWEDWALLIYMYSTKYYCLNGGIYFFIILNDHEKCCSRTATTKHFGITNYDNFIKYKASPFGKNALKVDHLQSSFTSILIGNGKYTLFWEDIWAANANIKSIFPTLYWLAIDRYCSVAIFMNKLSIDDNFRQPLLQ